MHTPNSNSLETTARKGDTEICRQSQYGSHSSHSVALQALCMYSKPERSRGPGADGAVWPYPGWAAVIQRSSTCPRENRNGFNVQSLKIQYYIIQFNLISTSNALECTKS